ncbi:MULTISPECIES: LysR family transcriptional regulator [Nitrospirillum]|nr:MULTISPECIES: LysR family transcriptional regulator [Nitrospirillum]MEA1674613.1 LysR family transcriptional regulator [Nitrospirillum sp. BR 11163]TWB43146.1 DNA-binding transcriptional LysR family regulator [Nitrospirillum amazonense]TWB64385.1 DNA-binding transcriptional LysR family regulator [Nitrospirillum amazonense]
MDDKIEVGNAVALMSFAAVVSTGSFSAAAKWLNCSKAAVSRQIAQLESDAGTKLLDRTTRSISVTPAGQQIYDRCARIIDEVNEANQVMAGMLTTPRGDLKVNAPVVASLFRVTEFIPQFLTQHPDVRVHLNLSDSQVDLLRGHFDAAFWVGEPYDSALDAVKLCEYDMVLAGSPDYFAKHGTPSSPAELKEHDCVVETHLSRPGEWQLSKDLVVPVVRGQLTSNSVRMTRQAILAGMGIAFLPRFLLEQDIAGNRLEVVLSNHVSAKVPLYLIFPRGNYLLAKVKAFVDFLSANLPSAKARSDDEAFGYADAS